MSGATTPVQADAIDFTGGTNTLDLSTGTLSGNVGVDGAGTTLNFDQSANATLANVITGTGAIIDSDTGTLTLSGASTYTGGTALNVGTLELGQQSSAGTGAITFGADTAETLRIDADDGTLGASLAGFAATDVIDLKALKATGATASYDGTTLTVTSGNTTEAIAIDPAPSGQEYVLSADTAQGGTDVTLAAIPAPTFTAPAQNSDTNNDKPTISGTGVSGDTVDLSISNGSGNPMAVSVPVTNGVWSYTPTTALPDGTYAVFASQTSPSGMGASPQVADGFTIDTTAPTITSDTASPATGDFGSGKTISFTLATSEAVTVTGTPMLALNDGGGFANYDAAASKSTSLVFDTTIAAGQNAATLKVTGSVLNSATIKDAAGNEADLAGAAATFNGLQVDTTAPTIASEAASPTGADLNAGKVVTFTVQTSEAVTAAGSSLSLSNGATASYASGGTEQANGSISPLTYTYTVVQGDTNTADLQATMLNGAITDGAGNILNDTSFTTIDTTDRVDTVAPTITAISDSGAGIDPNGNGDLNAGKTVTLTVTTSEAVTITAGVGGTTPTLTLNDGGTATYTGGSGTTQQTFSYIVAAGQNTARLAVTQVNANGATVTDAAGNPIDTSLAGASVPSGTLEIDTTPPTVSSPTLTVAQNIGPTAIGIAAPSDTPAPQGALTIAAGNLPSDGTVTLADGKTAVTSGETLTAAQLESLEFTPTPGVSNQGSIFTYSVTDGAGNASTGTAALNIGAAGAPTIAGTHATATSAEAPVTPFSGVTVTDPNAGVETLSIVLQNGGGTLTGDGLFVKPDGSYTLSGSAATVTQELDALSFTPTAPAPGTSTTTTFVLADTSSAGTSVTDAGTSVTDTAAAAPPPPPPPNPTPAVDTVSIDPNAAFFGRGTFVLTGTASSTVGVSSVEISAQVDGVETDLGAATLNGDGTFGFVDHVGAHVQGFITATETDEAGGTASFSPLTSLKAGIKGQDYVARQDDYTADGLAYTSNAYEQDDGSRTVAVRAFGQTLDSQFEDTFANHGRGDTTFVFTPGYGQDSITEFRLAGPGHDTVALPSADFASFAQVLRDTQNTPTGAVIHDNTSGDTLLLAGVSKTELLQHKADFTFHA